MKKSALRLLFLVNTMLLFTQLQAQKDSGNAQKITLDSFLTTRKGMFKSIARNLVRDTNSPILQRTDQRFQRYSGWIIRNIQISQLLFGTPITDTAKRMKNALTRIATGLHRQTRPFAVYNNLFFQKGDTLDPYLLADNERYLRNIPYLHDATIEARPVPGSPGLIDLVVITKDVLSIGASSSSVTPTKTDLLVSEDNLAGWGDRLAVKILYESSRRTKSGLGFEYFKRNIAGSFIDAYAGYNNFSSTINGYAQESIGYVRLLKPLVNAYTKWTYAFEAANHQSKNLYNEDSIFKAFGLYHYYNLDAWIGYNTNGQGLSRERQEKRLRSLIGLRMLEQRFTNRPYNDTFYSPSYANITGVLGSFSVFRQDFYKTRYIYGFGRSEDVPQGVDVTITAGWVRKETRSRPYVGFSFERYYFTNHENYFDFIVRADSYLHRGKMEDINVLGNINFFTRLYALSEKWKQRSFLGISFTRQYNTLLNIPLQIKNDFGLPEYNNGDIGGYFRASVRGESVFFSPWSFLSFKFAPFTFYSASYFAAGDEPVSKGGLYSALGGGVRTRNESLVFGTLELKAWYFPRKTAFDRHFRVELRTNLRFRYNTDFIRRPDFVRVN